MFRAHLLPLSPAFSLVFALGAPGCLPTGGGRECRGIEPNGPDLTGTAMSRKDAAGCPIQGGIQLRVASLDRGVRLQSGEELRDVTVAAGILKSATKPHANFVGATLSGTAESGHAVTLRIDEIAAPDAKSGGVTRYRLAYRFVEPGGTGAPFAPLCPGGELAIAVPGQWDLTIGPGGGSKRTSISSDATFACTSSAIAKCVTILEYRPWAATPTGVSLNNLHQSCVRAVRADYCGNGQPNTRKDERINFYDNAGVQKDAAEWPMEAVWSPEGARCVESTRLQVAPADPQTKRSETNVRDYIARTCPQILHACTERASAAAGPALLFTEVAPSTP